MHIFVSGVFDMLHSGHVEFLRHAGDQGYLHVAVGSDENVAFLKGRRPVYTQDERLFMVKSIEHVYNAFIAEGSGELDFAGDLVRIMPQRFVVNEDGHSEAKQALCVELGIDYRVYTRRPREGFPTRSTSALRGAEHGSRPQPYRLCLAGCWIDQPFVNAFEGGSVVVAQIEYDPRLKSRSGLATSSRRELNRLGDAVDHLHESDLAWLLFCQENRQQIIASEKHLPAGSQDHIGTAYAGINRLDYDRGAMWPFNIVRCLAPDVCDWLEQHLVLVPIVGRPGSYDPIRDRDLSWLRVREIGLVGAHCWQAIMDRDLHRFGATLTETHCRVAEALPRTTSPEIHRALSAFDRFPGRSTTGAGGGYAMVAVEDPAELPDALRIKVSRGG